MAKHAGKLHCAIALGSKATSRGHSLARLTMVLGLVASGALEILVRETFPLSQAAEAHRIIETGHGRIAIRVRNTQD